MLIGIAIEITIIIIIITINLRFTTMLKAVFTPKAKNMKNDKWLKDNICLIIPFMIKLKTNIVESLMELIKKHMKRNRNYSEIFRNKIRIDCSLTSNLATTLASINNKKLDSFYEVERITIKVTTISWLIE